MRLLKDIYEMARTAQVCANCGRELGVGKNHFYYKDKTTGTAKYKCKGTGTFFSAAAPGTAPSTPGASTALPTAPAATPAPTTPRVPTPAKAPRAPIPGGSGTDRIKQWLDEHKITGYTIRSDGLVDVSGHVILNGYGESTLPVKFGKITGEFHAGATALTTMDGMPSHTTGDCMLDTSKFTSCHGLPANMECEGSFALFGNKQMTSLDGMNIKTVGKILYLSKLPLIKDLKDIHERVHHVGETIVLAKTPIESHVLGLMLIPGLKNVEGLEPKGVLDILNKYLAGDRDLYMCQDELIDAGFLPFAKL